ncbi:pyridoxal-dependent decarboxylase [Catellatospora sp. NPDC049133]|uniref:pyridoxal-dependent decarboxylase n=1 Tax=Catellatospora sp. NPDC049133 TaxID=3155499 RepID=UPI0033EC1E91
MHRADRSASGLFWAASARRIGADVEAVRQRSVGARRTLGDQLTSDLSHPQVAALLTQCLLDSARTRTDAGRALQNVVLDLMAELLRAPADRWRGYVTHGSAAGTLHALRTARERYPEAIVLRSTAAHASVAAAAELLSMPTAVVASTSRGEMDYGDLEARLAQHRHRRPVIVATAGTPLTEAVDDLHRIVAVCHRLGIADRFVHVDAAFSGIPLALRDPMGRPGFDFADGADSVVVSGHKFLSTLLPCGILLVKGHVGGSGHQVPDPATGHLALLLWEVMRRHGVAGLRARASRAEAVADYAEQALVDAGWPAWRHPHALTVVLRCPPTPVAEQWGLPDAGGWTRLVCLPGVTRRHVDAFVAALPQPGGSAEGALVLESAGVR